MKTNLKTLALGIVIGATLVSGIAWATTGRNIWAEFADIEIFIDGEELVPRDVTGRVVEPFIVDGTTFVPIRAISEAYDRIVDWSVFWDGIGRITISTPLESTWTQEQVWEASLPQRGVAWDAVDAEMVSVQRVTHNRVGYFDERGGFLPWDYELADGEDWHRRSWEMMEYLRRVLDEYGHLDPRVQNHHAWVDYTNSFRYRIEWRNADGSTEIVFWHFNDEDGEPVMVNVWC